MGVKLLQIDNCDTLNSDGKFLEIDEKYKKRMNYSAVANKNVTMKVEFWHRFSNMEDCGSVCVFKAVVRTTFAKILSALEKHLKKFTNFSRKTFVWN